MKKSAKIQQMVEYEITNCRKNISFYKDQMRKNRRNNQFYAEQIEHMKSKMTDLQSSVESGMALSALLGKT